MSVKNMRKRELIVKRNYTFWQHPIKWFKDRKVTKAMDFIINNEWENGMREKVMEKISKMWCDTLTKDYLENSKGLKDEASW